MHARQQIRNAIVARLTGLATTGPRVFNTRVYPSGDANLPGISVYTPTDAREDDGRDAAFREWRRLTIVLEVQSKPPEGTEPQDQIDQIASEIEVAMMSDHDFGSRLKGLKLVSFTSAYSDELERPTGLGLLTWEAIYCVDARNPNLLPYAEG